MLGLRNAVRIVGVKFMPSAVRTGGRNENVRREEPCRTSSREC